MFKTKNKYGSLWLTLTTIMCTYLPLFMFLFLNIKLTLDIFHTSLKRIIIQNILKYLNIFIYHYITTSIKMSNFALKK